MDSPGRLILINKPLEWTSFDVVNKLRHRLKTKKIGHAGTLDPLATGLLIVCVGKMTKQIDLYQGMEKEYRGKFTLGQTTASHDLESVPTPAVETDHITDQLIFQVAASLRGKISQVPPAHSAIRVNGKRAYSFARKGEEVKLKPREVEVKEFEITAIQMPIVNFRIVCSKGTYIRSLARDFGERLGVGAYLSELCRSRIGEFTLENAQSLDEVAP